jgi:non-ribosomal peptide synthetase component E (peptide arylation enzyme)
MPDFIALDALVGQTAVNAPDRIAVVDGERQPSYAALDDLINRVAATTTASRSLWARSAKSSATRR